MTSGINLKNMALSLGFIVFLTACGDDTPPPPKPMEKNTHGVVLLFDEKTRNYSDINTCMLVDAAKRWVGVEYPGAVVTEERWASSAYFTLVIETEAFQTQVYFDGSIVNIPMECD